MSNKISFIVTFFSFVLKFCVIMLLCYCLNWKFRIPRFMSYVILRRTVVLS
ncbi:MAG: ABC-type glycerol-3-phosphate transport system permease component [Bacillariaceae sp.]|jgi:ABC-type glycerol-3-phosphate transport system permease component